MAQLYSTSLKAGLSNWFLFSLYSQLMWQQWTENGWLLSISVSYLPQMASCMKLFELCWTLVMEGIKFLDLSLIDSQVPMDSWILCSWKGLYWRVLWCGLGLGLANTRSRVQLYNTTGHLIDCNYGFSFGILKILAQGRPLPKIRGTRFLASALESTLHKLSNRVWHNFKIQIQKVYTIGKLLNSTFQ